MALEGFIPTIWSARLQRYITTNLVYGQPSIINREYEGDFAYGNKVKINDIGEITISDYTKNTDHAGPQTLDESQLEMDIDQAKMFNFQIDSIDKKQQWPKVMGRAMEKSSYGLSKVSENFVSAMHVDVTAGGNTIGTDGAPIVPTAATAYELLVDMKTMLDENDTPDEGRFVIVPPWYEGFMLKDDRFVKTGSSQADGILRNGKVAEAAGFEIYKSNNVPNTADTLYKIIGGVNWAWSFVDQIMEMENYKPERRFAEAVKALHVYGGKVLYPANLAVITANRA